MSHLACDPTFMGLIWGRSHAQVLLLSAQDAMLSRLMLKGKASKEERLRFGKLAFGSRRAVSTSDEEYMQVL